jgi:hypothetical protein
MSATSLIADIVSSLESQTTALRRVYYGTRLQTSALPAITFEVQSGTRVALGNTSTLSAYDVTINAISDSVSAAKTLDDEIRTTVLTGIIGTIVICNQYGTVQEPVAENGDEAGLYIVTSQFTIYQEGP